MRCRRHSLGGEQRYTLVWTLDKDKEKDKGNDNEKDTDKDKDSPMHNTLARRRAKVNKSMEMDIGA